MIGDNTRLVTIVGFPRSGTTWFHKFLRQHDGVFVPYIKEIDYFARRDGVLTDFQVAASREIFEALKARREVRGLGLGADGLERKDHCEMRTNADYRRFYQSRAGDRPFVDVSPSYCSMSVAGFRRIKQTMPGAKIVMLLRDRADWIWSAVNHKHRKFMPDMSIMDVFAEVTQPKDQETPPVLLRSGYAEVYEKICQIFDPAEVLCLFTEDLFGTQTQQRVIDQFCHFAGVETRPVGDFEFSKNRGIYEDLPREVTSFVVQRYAQDYVWALRHMGRLPDRWHAQYRSVMGREVPSA